MSAVNEPVTLETVDRAEFDQIELSQLLLEFIFELHFVISEHRFGQFGVRLEVLLDSEVDERISHALANVSHFGLNRNHCEGFRHLEQNADSGQPLVAFELDQIAEAEVKPKRLAEIGKFEIGCSIHFFNCQLKLFFFEKGGKFYFFLKCGSM